MLSQKYLNLLNENECIIAEIFGVILDSEKQNFLLLNSNVDKNWMLDFVYDIVLQKELEAYYNILCNKKTLDKNIKNNVLALSRNKI